MANSISGAAINDALPGQNSIKTSEMASKQLAGDLQSFLKILTVQMQNQDPFNPTDSTEFVSQLVQFANIEQSITHNKKLDALIDIQKNQQATQAINFIGKEVKYQGNQFYYDGKNVSHLTIHLPQDIPNLNYTIFDDKGHFVFSQTQNAKAGALTLNFGDHPDYQNKPIKPGSYRIEVKTLDKDHLPIKNSKGDFLDCPITIQGTVSKVEKVDKDPVLYIESVAVPFHSIQSFFDKPPISETEPKEQPILPLPLAMEVAMQ